MRPMMVVSMVRGESRSADFVAEIDEGRGQDEERDRYRDESGVVHRGPSVGLAGATGEPWRSACEFMAATVPPKPPRAQLITPSKPLRVC
jgi:hypothetical protein